MLDVGTESGEMMTVSRNFRAIHVVCLWIQELSTLCHSQEGCLATGCICSTAILVKMSFILLLKGPLLVILRASVSLTDMFLWTV
jgi:hypothetical protein